MKLSKTQAKVLEKLQHPIEAAIFVGTPVGVRPLLNYDRDLARLQQLRQDPEPALEVSEEIRYLEGSTGDR